MPGMNSSAGFALAGLISDHPENPTRSSLSSPRRCFDAWFVKDAFPRIIWTGVWRGR